ncbi:MAG: copper homeostasis protein CutC [Bacteroidota bacterium]
MKPYEVEVCVDSAESALEAERLGADRVELCARLDLDGLTPSPELIARTRAAISIGLHVIIRPREGDFHYTASELDVMCDSIRMALDLGADGIVSGALTADQRLDLDATTRLIKAAQGKTFTFHRAFDVCQQPLVALAALDKLGVQRLLSSGQAPKAIEGVATLQRLVDTKSTTAIMAGSGVNADNIPALWEAGIRQFHFTSHRPGPSGQNVFDSEKTQRAIETLNRLCAR